MNTKKFLKIYLFICIFPVWALSEKILFSSYYIFFIPYALLYLSLVPYINLEKNYKFTLFIVSFLTVFAIDQNLSLSKSLIKPNFDNCFKEKNYSIIEIKFDINEYYAVKKILSLSKAWLRKFSKYVYGFSYKYFN